MILLVTFINQVNRKFGTGVLLPLLLGKYRKPHAEERVFMFMDLKSSTTIAEYMGHVRYSEFISDSFMDINHILPKYKAEIYQYVGDEIVLSWKVTKSLSYDQCVEFFYACENEFKKRRPYYIKKYHEVPTFKVGLHTGIVSAVEIGEMKRDIAYHGDTINITARIQSLCNVYGKKLLASAEFAERCELANGMVATPVGSTLLKGKTLPVSIFSIEPVQVLQQVSREVFSDSV
jgi:adenylate cyclase